MELHFTQRAARNGSLLILSMRPPNLLVAIRARAGAVHPHQAIVDE